MFDAGPANDLPEVPDHNVCPTDPVAVVVAGRKLVSMRWGFIPSWYKTPSDGPLLINARAETIAEKPALREACRARRWLIPATGFYEWTKDADGNRLPWYIAPKAGPLVFAGVWQVWEQGDARHVTCAIVTTAANAAMSAMHHRMPVTLSADQWGLWLGEQGKGAARVMMAAPEVRFAFLRGGSAGNSNRATGAGLIAPV